MDDNYKIGVLFQNGYFSSIPVVGYALIDWGIDADTGILWCFVKNNEETLYQYFPLSNITSITSNIPIQVE